eukprot:snap_masked-scaffold_2-processed-gene-21.0-mRNA-1 protein AED:0.80 eAED:1.00 QI:0/-1/0/1/-1/1/1/0/276
MKTKLAKLKRRQKGRTFDKLKGKRRQIRDSEVKVVIKQRIVEEELGQVYRTHQKLRDIPKGKSPAVFNYHDLLIPSFLLYRLMKFQRATSVLEIRLDSKLRKLFRTFDNMVFDLLWKTLLLNETVIILTKDEYDWVVSSLQKFYPRSYRLIAVHISIASVADQSTEIGEDGLTAKERFLLHYSGSYFEGEDGRLTSIGCSEEQYLVTSEFSSCFPHIFVRNISMIGKFRFGNVYLRLGYLLSVLSQEQLNRYEEIFIESAVRTPLSKISYIDSHRK